MKLRDVYKEEEDCAKQIPPFLFTASLRDHQEMAGMGNWRGQTRKPCIKHTPLLC